MQSEWKEVYMNIGITGTRFGLTGDQAAEFKRQLEALGTSTLHHGDCVGADADCHDIAEALGWNIVIHPPAADNHRANKQSNDIREPLNHLCRNRAIVTESNLLLAAPGGDKETFRSGTWYTIRHAIKEGVPVRVILPDGSVIEGEEILNCLLPGKWGA